MTPRNAGETMTEATDRATTTLLDATYAALRKTRREIDDVEDRAIIDGEQERDLAIEEYEERCNE